MNKWLPDDAGKILTDYVRAHPGVAIDSTHAVGAILGVDTTQHGGWMAVSQLLSRHRKKNDAIIKDAKDITTQFMQQTMDPDADESDAYNLLVQINMTHRNITPLNHTDNGFEVLDFEEKQLNMNEQSLKLANSFLYMQKRLCSIGGTPSVLPVNAGFISSRYEAGFYLKEHNDEEDTRRGEKGDKQTPL